MTNEEEIRKTIDEFEHGTFVSQPSIILEALKLMLSSTTRERICSFDVLTTNDVAELNHLSKGQASELMTRIKRKGDILGIKGKIHITDYLRFFNVNPGEIYRKENVNAKFTV